MNPIDIQVNRLKVKPILHMLAKKGIIVLQRILFYFILFTFWAAVYILSGDVWEKQSNL